MVRNSAPALGYLTLYTTILVLCLGTFVYYVECGKFMVRRGCGGGSLGSPNHCWGASAAAAAAADCHSY
jgi:hypothetical protein